MRRTTFLLLALLLCYSSYAQSNTTNSLSNTSTQTDIGATNSTVVYSVLDTPQNCAEFISLVKNLYNEEGVEFTQVNIKSYTSPEGTISLNKKLAKKRSEKVIELLSQVGEIPSSIINAENIATDWDLFEKCINESGLSDSDKKAVMDIVRNYPEEEVGYRKPGDKYPSILNSRSYRFNELNYGHTYRYMLDNIYQKMRISEVEIQYTKTIEVAPVEEIVEEKVEVIAEPVQDTVAKEVAEPIIEMIDRPLFAVKTNLLMLGAGIANIGAEVSIGEKMSVELPFMYSPYTIKRDYKLRVLAIQPAFKYWLGQGHKGHYFGANLGLGWYNVATNDAKRYQSNNPLGEIGLSYGYRLQFCKHWAAEFEIGAGWASSSYDIFYNFNNGALMDTGYMSYWGITKAGISLVYTFNFVKDEKR